MEKGLHCTCIVQEDEMCKQMWTTVLELQFNISYLHSLKPNCCNTRGMCFGIVLLK